MKFTKLEKWTVDKHPALKPTGIWGISIAVWCQRSPDDDSEYVQMHGVASLSIVMQRWVRDVEKYGEEITRYYGAVSFGHLVDHIISMDHKYVLGSVDNPVYYNFYGTSMGMRYLFQHSMQSIKKVA